MTLDRITPPAIQDFAPLHLPAPTVEKLSNGIPVYTFSMGEQEVCRIDWMIEGGNYEETVHPAATFTHLMLKEGAAGRHAKEIAETLDFYGAWLQTSTSMHFSYITVYMLNKHVHTLLPVMADLIQSPDFPEKELQRLKEKRMQLLLLNREKVNNLSHAAFNSMLFGADHPYAYEATETDIAQIQPAHLFEFHRRYYRPERCRILLSGNITDEIHAAVEQYFGKEWTNSPRTETVPEETIYPMHPQPEKETIVHKADALQSGIRIGAQVINRDHPDYQKLRILSTALGGYFGSRLMANIREEKGYTYGISSSVAGLRQAAYIVISTQSGTEFTRPLIREVFTEIERLRTEAIGAEEMETLRNYLRGEMARTLDSPFTIADYYISLLANRLPSDYFSLQDRTIREITADELLRVARTHLDPEKFVVAIAGDRTKIGQ